MGARDAKRESGRLRNAAFRCFAAGAIIVALTATGLGAMTTVPSVAATRGAFTGSVTSAAGTIAPRAGRNIQPEDTDPTLAGVSCAGAGFCAAVGFYSQCPGDCGGVDHVMNENPQDLVETWNGTAWTVDASPQPAGADMLSAVSCSSVSFCMAVGTNDFVTNTLAMTWNGSAWSLLPSPNPSAYNTFNAVSCSGPDFCMAFGTMVGSEDQYLPLAASWDGSSWTVVNSPLPYLTSAVSCTSPDFCMGVGVNGFGARQTAAATWDGTAWTTISSPNPDSDSDYFDSVSCVSSTSCLAVGAQVGNSSSLVEVWNGATWTEGPEFNEPTGASGSLVSCVVGSSYCMVITSYGAETWDGTAWTNIAYPEPGTAGPPSCTSSTWCMAVGGRNQSGLILEADSWDGSHWTDVPVPSPDAVSITSTSLPDGSVGVSYDATLSASGGNPPYQWKVVSGSLPKGLKLNKNTGEVSGTPKSAGTSDFTAEVWDTKSPKVAKASRVQNTAEIALSISIST
jgi:hypothetical protein